MPNWLLNLFKKSKTVKRITFEECLSEGRIAAAINALHPIRPVVEKALGRFIDWCYDRVCTHKDEESNIVTRVAYDGAVNLSVDLTIVDVQQVAIDMATLAEAAAWGRNRGKGGALGGEEIELQAEKLKELINEHL